MRLRNLFQLALVTAGLVASPALAKDPNCENRAAKAAKDCKRACEKMKDQPEMKNNMKAARVGSCDQMCSMVEDQSLKACEKKKKERRR